VVINKRIKCTNLPLKSVHRLVHPVQILRQYKENTKKTLILRWICVMLFLSGAVIYTKVIRGVMLFMCGVMKKKVKYGG